MLVFEGIDKEYPVVRKIIQILTIGDTVIQKIRSFIFLDDYCDSKKVYFFLYFNSIICAVFLVLLGYGYYFQDPDLLSILNLLKYPIVPLIGYSIFGSYKLKKINFLFPIIGALIILWFIGCDSAYRWDAIQHVARAKFFMENNFFEPLLKDIHFYI